MTISQRIFELLAINNLKNADLAKATGISPNTIGDWKRKGTNPQADKIYSICEYLGVSLEYLLTGCEKSNTNSAANILNSNVVQGNHAGTLIVKNGHTEERSISEQELEILRLYNSLNVKKKTELLSYAYDLEGAHNRNDLVN